MNLSKDRIIHIGLVVIIIILTGTILTIALSGDKEINPEKSPWLIENGEENVETEDITSDEEKKEEVEETIVKPVVTTPTIKTPVVAPKVPYTSVCTPSLSGKKSSTYKGILLNWTACRNEGFQYYKIVRSTTNTNPTYPGDNVILSSANRNVTNYIDKVVAHSNTYHYKVCAVHRLKKITCGNKISVEY